MTTNTATFHKVNPIALASWSTMPVAYADPPVPEPPVIIQEPEYPPTYPDQNGYALLDTARTRQDQGRCINCGAEHYTWQCVEIGDLLLAL